MVLRVKLVGSGTPDDAYRVNLPTYRVIFRNDTQGWAIVDLPDDIHELTDDDLAGNAFDVTSHGRFFASLQPSTLDLLHDKLDGKYAEHRGEFRAEIV